MPLLPFVPERSGASPDNGRKRAPAARRPGRPARRALSAGGRRFAGAALFGADKLRKPGRRMEGSVKSLEPRAPGLRSWFPRHGCGTAILESALSKRCGAGLGVGLAVSPFQPCSVMGEVAKPLSEGGLRGPYAWPWASQLRGCAGATPTLQPLRGPLGLPRPPQGGGQGEEPLGAPQSCHDVVQFWLRLSGGP